MDLFVKFSPLLQTRSELLGEGADPFAVCMEQLLSPTEAMIHGRPTILAGTNNYLGLTFDQRCIDAAIQALQEQGTGTTGSRMANGTYASHVQLERTIADFYGMQSAIVFSTGFQANLSMLSSLAGHDDYIFMDADCHASIYDGVRMSSAKVIRFRHNDPQDLEKRLRRLGSEHQGGVLIVVEGIYSMLGDIAPLQEIAAIKSAYNATLLVDEAHSLGCFGHSGRGLSQALEVEHAVDFIVGTFSKSVGTMGGFCVSNHPHFNVLRMASRPYIFTASLPPSTVASAIKAFEIIADSPQLRTSLWDNVQQLHQGFSQLGFDLGAAPSPIVAVKVANPKMAITLWNYLLHHGIYVNLAIPPATPDGLSLLRCSVCAAHSPEQINKIIAAFGQAWESLKEQ